MAKRAAQSNNQPAKGRAKRAQQPLPKLPEEILTYLKDECCDDGIVMLHVLLEGNSPALIVAAVKAAIRPRLAKARQRVERKIRESRQAIDEYKKEIEALTGRPVVVTY